MWLLMIDFEGIVNAFDYIMTACVLLLFGMLSLILLIFTEPTTFQIYGYLAVSVSCYVVALILISIDKEVPLRVKDDYGQ